MVTGLTLHANERTSKRNDGFEDVGCTKCHKSSTKAQNDYHQYLDYKRSPVTYARLAPSKFSCLTTCISSKVTFARQKRKDKLTNPQQRFYLTNDSLDTNVIFTPN